MRSASSRRGPAPDERLGFLEVRSHDGREWEEPRHERLHRVALQQLCPGACDHDRVDDKRDAPSLEKVRDGVDNGAREEHPCLGSIDADVVMDGVELRANEVRR